jgi:hypothetical protein
MRRAPGEERKTRGPVGPLGSRAREASLVRPSASTRLLERCPPAALGSSETKCPKQHPAWLRLCRCGRATAPPGKPDFATPAGPRSMSRRTGTPTKCRIRMGLPDGRGHREGESGSGGCRNRFLASKVRSERARGGPSSGRHRHSRRLPSHLSTAPVAGPKRRCKSADRGRPRLRIDTPAISHRCIVFIRRSG